MIVCSCSGISDREVHAAIDWMRAADPDTLITPGKIYKALGRTPDCGGCIRLFVATMRTSAALRVARPGADEVPEPLRYLRAVSDD